MADRALQTNLPLLQGHIKRDPQSYKDDFLLQYRHYESTLAVFALQPADSSSADRLSQLISFLAAVVPCYSKTEEAQRFPAQLISTLRQYHATLSHDVRLSMCKALVLLRNRNLASPLEVLQLFFDLFRAQDKELRKYLFASIVSYIRKHGRRSHTQLISSLQVYIFSKLQCASVDGSSAAGGSGATTTRMALLILIDLYRRGVWTNARVVNVIASAVFHRNSRVMATAIKFFVGNNDYATEDDDEDSSDDAGDDNRTLKDVMMTFRVAKKTKRREKQMLRAKNAVTKARKSKKKASLAGSGALQLLYDAQDFAERLQRRLEKSTDRYEFRVLMMSLVSRCIATHDLLVLPFYPYIARFLTPRQREVTRLLFFAAQAVHSLVPPDIVADLIRTIVNNFVTDRNTDEVITVGLNTVREICVSCPYAVTEELLHDLSEYQSYKNKNVVTAARALVHLYRMLNPALLRKKDRGRPTQQTDTATPAEYGRQEAPRGVVGAEILAATEDVDSGSESDDEAEEEDDKQVSDCDVSEDEEQEDGADADDVEEMDDADAETSTVVAKKKVTFEDISSERVFTEEDHRKIAAYNIARKLQRAAPKRDAKRVADTSLEDLMTQVEEEGEEEEQGRKKLTLGDIEHLTKRPKADKEARLASIREGREGRERFGAAKKRDGKGPHVGRTQKSVHRHNRAIAMTKHSRKQRKVLKKSFREKQMHLRNRLLKVSKHR